jgi:riboflavin kinase/FMN adenylyltransferase
VIPRPNSQPVRHGASNTGVDDPSRLVAIGNFDGVHRGHQYLVAQVLAEATAHNLRPSILTFDPHPAVVLGRPLLPPITRLETKLKLLQGLSPNLDVLVEPFSLELAQMTPREFAQRILIEQHAAGRVLVGANFRFGRDRAGTLSTLQSVGAELGFSAAALPLLQQAGDAISSSRVRSALANGDVAEAAALLGRPHAVQGSVVHGQHLGRTLGFPTANLGETEELLPANGVYSCRVRNLAASAHSYDAVCNLGLRPTVGAAGGAPVRKLEVHLLGVEVDLYGLELRVEFIGRIRAEERFSGVDALRVQITRDIEVAREQLRPLAG